jgi:hypothetical protein
LIIPLTERIKMSMERHPDWTDERLASAIRGATRAAVRIVRSGAPAAAENGGANNNVSTEERRSPSTGIISLEIVRKRYDIVAAIQRELERLPVGKIIPERELSMRTVGKDAARFRRAVENNAALFKKNRVKLKLNFDTTADGQWWWGCVSDIDEVLHLRDE